MKEVLIIVGLVVAWVLLTQVVLPKFGIEPG